MSYEDAKYKYWIDRAKKIIGEYDAMIDKYDEINIPTEVEADGFITRTETLERINASKAKPMTKCIYPKCEECDKYHGHYCTVPMVISKQIWTETAVRIVCLEKRLTELETLVTDEILRSDEERERVTYAHSDEVNYTWEDYFKENE